MNIVYIHIAMALCLSTSSSGLAKAGDKAGAVWNFVPHDPDKADDGGCRVELLVAAAEGGVGEDVAPALADE